jgi:excisionase family DNA binding protein
MSDTQFADVLTPAEAASFLRVPEQELVRLAEQREIPAQRIGSEWRFLKRALEHWLTYGPRFCRDYPPWLLEHPALEELLFLLQKRLLQQTNPEKPKKGSKAAMGKHAGVFKDEDDLTDVLASLASL